LYIDYESKCRYFKHPVHNEIVELVIRRVKAQLGYPETQGDLVTPASLLYRYFLNVNIYDLRILLTLCHEQVRRLVHGSQAIFQGLHGNGWN
jgi:hypothetical protein